MLKQYPFHNLIRICIPAFIFLAVNVNTNAQLFPGLEGEQLVEAIQFEYTPQQLLNETQVKDTLYARIFIQDDTVKCIYSGLPRFLPEGVDPSQYLFGSGLETESLNLEHSWPQAKGAGDGTNGNMDMHHLYPSRVEINSDRGNHPFLESSDQSTQKWYLLYQEMANKPASNIDAYSELGQSLFEPRESVKGDLARAMFYFWTIYREDAIEADPDFFELQRENLCNWHQSDPVDNFESLRNERIAFYQDGKLNPFIVDCTLADRAYCTAQISCETAVDQGYFDLPVDINYNPSIRSFEILSLENRELYYSIHSLLGQHIVAAKTNTGTWNSVDNLMPGLYFLVISSDGKKSVKKAFFQ